MTASVAVFALMSWTGQATAADGPTALRSDGATVRVATDAEGDASVWAASNPQVMAAASNACGGKYTTLNYVDGTLPGDTKHDDGSLIGYIGGGYQCLIFVNESQGTGANYMFFQACPNKSASSACGQDEGHFSTYAGPLYITRGTGGCFTVSYKMRDEADTRYLINGKRSYSC